MNTFINMLSVIGIDVKSTISNPDTLGCNRKDKANTIQTGFDRCPIRQAQHGGTGSECSPRILSKLHAQDKRGKSAKGTSRTKTEKARTTYTITFAKSSFLFSFQFMQILQSIDDICSQVNPILWSMLL